MAVVVEEESVRSTGEAQWLQRAEVKDQSQSRCSRAGQTVDSAVHGLTPRPLPRLRPLVDFSQSTGALLGGCSTNPLRHSPSPIPRPAAITLVGRSTFQLLFFEAKIGALACHTGLLGSIYGWCRPNWAPRLPECAWGIDSNHSDRRVEVFRFGFTVKLV